MLYMDAISSSHFRKTYASLTEPVLVTVNGHVIGQWSPIAARSTGTAHIPDVKKPAVVETASLHTFRPVPKPGR